MSDSTFALLVAVFIISIFVFLIILIIKKLKLILTKIDDTINSQTGILSQERKLNEITKTLASAIEEENRTIQALPTLISSNLSSGIASGLGPLGKKVNSLIDDSKTNISSLVDQLKKNHTDLNGVLLTLNGEGHFHEMLEQLYQISEPLNQMGQTVDFHYQTAEKLLLQSTQFAEKWAGHWDKVSNSFQTFSDSFTNWSVAESTSNRELESRISNRLKEVGEIIRHLSENHGEMKTALIRLEEFQKRLFENSVNIAQQISNFEHIIKDNQMNYESIVNSHKSLVDQFSKWANTTQKRIDEICSKLNSTTDHFNNLTNIITASQQNSTNAIKNAMEKISSALDRLTVQSSKASMQTFQLVISIFILCLLTYIALHLPS